METKYSTLQERVNFIAQEYRPLVEKATGITLEPIKVLPYTRETFFRSHRDERKELIGNMKQPYMHLNEKIFGPMIIGGVFRAIESIAHLGYSLIPVFPSLPDSNIVLYVNPKKRFEKLNHSELAFFTIYGLAELCQRKQEKIRPYVVDSEKVIAGTAPTEKDRSQERLLRRKQIVFDIMKNQNLLGNLPNKKYRRFIRRSQQLDLERKLT